MSAPENNAFEGQKTFSGRRFTRFQAAEYNRWNLKASQYEAEGLPVPDHVLNARHKAYCMAAAFGLESTS